MLVFTNLFVHNLGELVLKLMLVTAIGDLRGKTALIRAL